MKIQWVGHACFKIVIPNGKTVITDPFDSKVGYPPAQIPADIVTVSHQHFDHNAVNTIPGNPVVIQEEGVHNLDGIKITGILSYHDTSEGAQRGKNIIFVLEVDGIRVCHLGDLGHLLDSDQIAKIGAVDVLLVPTGGYYTISPEEAVQVVAQINPRYAVPMHFKTDYINLPICSPEPFLNHFPGHSKEKELVIAGKGPRQATQAVLLELKK